MTTTQIGGRTVSVPNVVEDGQCARVVRGGVDYVAPGGRRQGTDLPGKKPMPVFNPAPALSFVLFGQVSGGKNNIGITREGRRFPNKSFVTWRTSAAIQLTRQLPDMQRYANRTAFCKPMRVSLAVHYWPGDLKRRDAPALIDALCHLLERCGVVEDDAQIKAVDWQEMDLDRKNPRVELRLSGAAGVGHRRP